MDEADAQAQQPVNQDRRVSALELRRQPWLFPSNPDPAILPTPCVMAFCFPSLTKSCQLLGLNARELLCRCCAQCRWEQLFATSGKREPEVKVNSHLDNQGASEYGPKRAGKTL